ncbi:MAG: DUF599 domain-containing protein [Chromatiales bacterium]|nr:DUF599 domain-containing protein [Chromatiales bacterium]
MSGWQASGIMAGCTHAGAAPMPQVPVIDVLSLAWFVLLWAGYTAYADHRVRAARSLRAVMHGYRVQWMQQMLLRDNRVADVNIVRNLLAGVSFFASTTLLILAGVVTVLGSTDQVIGMVRELPFAAGTTLVQWELKLLVLGVIFVYAFFKFTWALRQFNYCTILIGAAPRGWTTPLPGARRGSPPTPPRISTRACALLLQPRRARLVPEPLDLRDRDHRSRAGAVHARVPLCSAAHAECRGRDKGRLGAAC